MSFQIETPVTCYLLPEDGEAAEAQFLKNLKDPGETWIIAYSFTLVPMIDELLDAHSQGVPLHLYLDHSQSSGRAAKPVIEKLVDAGIEVTIGTSPEGSRYICHTKGMVSDEDPQGGELFCWEGSVNFSASGWHQVNTAMTFSSPKWRDEFVAQFEALREFAWTHEAEMQLMPEPPAGLEAPTSSPAKQKRYDFHAVRAKRTKHHR
jgi:phosphatidylserine/phosphatidylglycerophosphate/cardiolipin synthase-like enzyme